MLQLLSDHQIYTRQFYIIKKSKAKRREPNSIRTTNTIITPATTIRRSKCLHTKYENGKQKIFHTHTHTQFVLCSCGLFVWLVYSVCTSWIHSLTVNDWEKKHYIILRVCIVFMTLSLFVCLYGWRFFFSPYFSLSFSFYFSLARSLSQSIVIL